MTSAGFYYRPEKPKLDITGPIDVLANTFTRQFTLVTNQESVIGRQFGTTARPDMNQVTR
jgi:hypothetical protein